MKRVALKRYKVSEDIFTDILTHQKKNIKYGDIQQYIYGYKNKKTIIFNGTDTLICREMFITVKPDDSNWKQVIVLVDRGLPANTFTKDVQGSDAWRVMTSIIKSHYTEEQFEQILQSHTHEKCKPIHFNPTKVSDKIVRHKNCYKYDINSAYCSAYITLFPKAKEDILKIYQERKIHPENKKILNYFNGMLKHKGYEGTYYWVVNRTNEILRSALDYVGGIKLYINTDGFIVKNPKHTLVHSTELGQFKEEYHGDVYIYIDKNYFLIQTGYEGNKPDLTGNCLLSARQDVNLEKGQVVHYTRYRDVLVPKGDGQEELAVYIVKDLIKENIEIE